MIFCRGLGLPFINPPIVYIYIYIFYITYTVYIYIYCTVYIGARDVVVLFGPRVAKKIPELAAGSAGRAFASHQRSSNSHLTSLTH